VGKAIVEAHKPIKGKTLAQTRKRFANETEQYVASATKGRWLTGNEPSDVQVAKAGGHGTHMIEVKSKSFADSKKLSVHHNAYYLKSKDAAEHPDHTWHTVLVDARQTSEAGKHASSYSGPDLYYKRSVGAYTLNQMHKVKDVAELNRLIAMPDHKLPELAKGTPTPMGKALDDLRVKAEKEQKYNNDRSKAKKAKLKAMGLSAYK